MSSFFNLQCLLNSTRPKSLPPRKNIVDLPPFTTNLDIWSSVSGPKIFRIKHVSVGHTLSLESVAFCQ